MIVAAGLSRTAFLAGSVEAVGLRKSKPPALKGPLQKERSRNCASLWPPSCCVGNMKRRRGGMAPLPFVNMQ